MTLLEDAKSLVEAGSHHVEGRYSDACAFCHFGDPDHASDCPWRAMPRIVAVLGAAQAVIDVQFAAWCAHADAINDLAEAMKGEGA